MKIKEAPVKFKVGPEDGLAEGEFIVYPSTFTREPDSYGDVVAKGAFLDDIKAWGESGNVLPGLYGHRMDDPDFFIAAASEMGEDDHGWWIKGMFDLESPKGPQVYRLVKGKRLNQLSFAYDVQDEAQVEVADGQKANELRKLKVYEFSFVPIGANQDTSVVAVKAAAAGLMADVKVGKPISAANEKAIDAIAEQMLAGGAELKNVLTAARGEEDDQGKASGDAEAKSGASDEEPEGAKSSASDEEPKTSPSVARLAAQAHLYALTGAGSRDSR